MGNSSVRHGERVTFARDDEERLLNRVLVAQSRGMRHGDSRRRAVFVLERHNDCFIVAIANLGMFIKAFVW